jgi:hypothetical protein
MGNKSVKKELFPKKSFGFCPLLGKTCIGFKCAWFTDKIIDGAIVCKCAVTYIGEGGLNGNTTGIQENTVHRQGTHHKL